MLRNLDPERAHREEVVDVLLRNFAGAIDLVGIDVVVQIFLELAQKFLAGRAIFGALLGKGKMRSKS